MGASLLHTGDLAEGRAHHAQALALYDPAELIQTGVSEATALGSGSCPII
jgi:hypothetical protein